MELTYTTPGLSEEASQKAIEILQGRLSQEQEAALILKHAHWNMKGANFIAIHEMLDPEVDSVLEQADETAERIAQLGGWSDGRADGIIAHRTWDQFSLTGYRDALDYVKALADYYASFVENDRQAIKQLDDLDVVSSNIIQDHVQSLEKFLWFLRAHLNLYKTLYYHDDYREGGLRPRFPREISKEDNIRHAIIRLPLNTGYPCRS